MSNQADMAGSGMVHQSKASSAFQRLPEELLAMVLQHISKLSDLNKLSKTCKQLHTRVLPLLFKHLRLRLPRSCTTEIGFLENLVTVPTRGLLHTCQLSVSMGPDDDPYLPTSSQIYELITRPVMVCAGHSNLVMRLFDIEDTEKPACHFPIFSSWTHDCICAAKTLNILWDRQHSTIQDIQVDQADPDFWSHRSGPAVLQTMAYTSSEFLPLCWFSFQAAQNFLTIRLLKYGQEMRVANWPLAIAKEHNYFYDKLNTSIGTESALTTKPLLGLQSLHLIGIKLRQAVQGNPLIVTRLEVLQDLCLESCTQVSNLLGVLASTRGVNLQLFRLRNEDSVELRIQLQSFLRSFSGLKHLYVLFDFALGPLDVSCFVHAHGRTLETLIWDFRRGPRSWLTQMPNYTANLIDPNILETPSDLERICLGCPNLEELGVSILDTMLEKDYLSLRNDTQILSAPNWALASPLIARLAHLRTLNIRNSPPWIAATGKASTTFAYRGHIYDCRVEQESDHLVKAVAEVIFRSVFECTSVACTQLSIVATSAFTIADRRLGRALDRTDEMHNILQPMIFLREGQSFSDDGEATEKVRCVGKGMLALEDAKYHSDHLRILEPCWAR